MLDEKLITLEEEMTQQYTEFKTNHDAFVNKGNKAAAQRARKAAGEFRKKVTDYRKASLNSVK